MTSVARRQEHDSGEYSDGSHQENDQENSGNDGQQESDYESQGSESEHSDREEENPETERRVDDDEDRSNPQYIPKRGTFYEHDDRTAASGEESANTTTETASEKKEGSEPNERRRPPRKSEATNKWSHDKFNENEQMPKSRDELVAIYGYDIRNEDAPPHARRNRRYGRGPNKYTRTWEDEEAYKRQNAAQTQTPRKPPTAEDFPELDNKNTRMRRTPRQRSKSQPSSTDSIESNHQLRRNASVKNKKPVKMSPRARPRESREREKENRENMPQIENLTITTSVVNNNSQTAPQRKVNATVAQQRPVPTEQGKKRPTPPQPPQPTIQNKSPPQSQQPKQTTQTQPQPLGNAGQESRTGSKRYSSLRQRPLDANYPQQQQQQNNTQQHNQQLQGQQQQQHRFHNEFNNAPAATQHQGSPVPQQIHPQHLMQQMRVTGNVTQTQHGPSPPHQQLPQQQLPQQQLPQQQLPQQQLPQQQLPQQQLQQQQLAQQQLSQQQLPQHSPQVRLGMIEQQQLVSHHSMHNIQQQHNIGQMQPNQGYAPPAMIPAQYMQPPNQGVICAGGAMFPQFPHPQIYPHHNVNYPTGGPVAYYSVEETAAPQRRRPTQAIPIVRPTHQERPANSSEKDNIDRIVENMFVRKPWPAHGAEGSKESSQPNSLTSSSISTDSKDVDKKEDTQKDTELQKETQYEPQKEEPQKEIESEPVEAKDSLPEA